MPQFTEEELMRDLDEADRLGDTELASAIAAQIKQLQAQPQVPAYTPENPSLGTTLGRVVGGSADVVSEALSAGRETYDNPRLAGVPELMRAPTAFARGAAEGVFKAADVASQALGDFGSMLTPDDLETAVVTNYNEFMDTLGNTALAKQALDALSKGYANLEAWGDENPRNGVIVENLKALGANKLASITSNARLLTGETVAKAGGKVVQSGKRMAGEQRYEKAREMLTPKNWRQKENYEVKGNLFDTIVWSPTKEQNEMISYMSEIEAFDPSRIAAYNVKQLDGHLSNKAESLNSRLANMKLPKVEMTKFRDELLEAGTNYLDSSSFKASGFSRGRAEAFLEIADDILSKTDGSVVSLHNARKAIDASMKKALKVDDLSDAEGKALKNEIMSIIRNGVNAKIFEVVPNDAPIREELRRQFLTFRARDILDDKARDEAATVVGRAVAAVEQATGLQLPSTLLGIGLTASAAGAVVAPMSPATIVLTAGAAGTAYLGNKMIKNPQGRKAIGSLITYLGKAIKSKSGKLADPILLNQAVELRDQLVEQYEYLYGQEAQ